VELQISDSQFCFASLLNLLKLTPNIESLEMFLIDITPRTDFTNQIKLEKLRRFRFENSASIEIFEKILKPNSLSEIQINFPRVLVEPESHRPANYWAVIPRILSKQEKLVSLKLDQCPITNFPDSPEIWALKNLLKLSLQSLTFPTPKDFENFTIFIKSLDKVTDLSLKQRKDLDNAYYDSDGDSIYEYDSDADDNRNDLTEILTHLLFLPTLTKLSFRCINWKYEEKILNLKIQNPSVEDLTIDSVLDEYIKYIKVFPNVRKATLHFYYSDLTTLNSWTLLEELELPILEEEIFYQIRVKTLICFKFKIDYKVEPVSLRHFCSNHPQLERMEVDGFNFEHLAVVVENLPNLKSLICKTIDPRHLSEEDVIKMIAEKCANLEYLEVELKEMKAETAVAILKEKLPGLRGCVKQFEGYSQLPDIIEL
jgi:hypothetical protein